MPSGENSIATRFSSENQPVTQGRTPGSKNRATVARKVLEMLIRIPDEKYTELLKSFPDLEQSITVEDYITMQQTVLATKETNAYKAIMDSAYGAPKQELEHSGEMTNKTVAIEIVPPKPLDE